TSLVKPRVTRLRPTSPPMKLLAPPITSPLAIDSTTVPPFDPTNPPSRALLPPITEPVANDCAIDPRLTPAKPPTVVKLPRTRLAFDEDCVMEPSFSPTNPPRRTKFVPLLPAPATMPAPTETSAIVPLLVPARAPMAADELVATIVALSSLRLRTL